MKMDMGDTQKNFPFEWALVASLLAAIQLLTKRTRTRLVIFGVIHDTDVS